MDVVARKGFCSSLEGVFALSEENVIHENQVTLGFCQGSLVHMQKQMREVTERNQELCAQLVASESREREIAYLSEAQKGAFEGKIHALEQEVQKKQCEVVAITKKADERVAVEVAKRVDAVQAAISERDAQASSLREEMERVVQENRRLQDEVIHQSQVIEQLRRVTSTQAAALQQEAEGSRQELMRARDLLVKQEQQDVELDRIQAIISTLYQGEIDSCFESLGTRSSMFEKEIEQLTAFIRGKKRMPSSEAQKIDEIRFLEKVLSGVTRKRIGYMPSPYPIAVQKASAQISALIAEKKRQ